MTTHDLDRQVLNELWQSARADVERYRQAHLAGCSAGSGWERALQEWSKGGFDNWWRVEWNRAQSSCPKP